MVSTELCLIISWTSRNGILFQLFGGSRNLHFKGLVQDYSNSTANAVIAVLH